MFPQQQGPFRTLPSLAIAVVVMTRILLLRVLLLLLFLVDNNISRNTIGVTAALSTLIKNQTCLDSNVVVYSLDDWDSYDQITSGKTVLIKFFAPWCEHCQKLAPIWEQLAHRYWQQQESCTDNNRTLLIGQVDCTMSKQHEDWCYDELHIVGLPTISYGDPSHRGVFLHTYTGERTLDTMWQFVVQELLDNPLASACSPGNLGACQHDATIQAQMAELWNLSLPDVEHRIQQYEQAAATAQDDFDQSFQQMQSSYDQYATEHDSRVAQIKANIRLLHSIRVMKMN